MNLDWRQVKQTEAKHRLGDTKNLPDQSAATSATLHVERR